MQETEMAREIRERIERAEEGVRRRMARVEERKQDAEEGLRRSWRAALDADTWSGVLFCVVLRVVQRTYLDFLECRHRSLDLKLYDVREEAVREWHEEAARKVEAEEEHRRRIREATAEISDRYDGRPTRVCGRPPETWEEVRLVEDFLSGAEERHDVVSSVWWADGSEAARRVREELERDLPLRVYERRKAAQKPQNEAR